MGAPSAYELIGAGLVVAAIVVLTVPSLARRKRAAAPPAPAREAVRR